MGWKRTAKIYVFFEMQSKYGNKYWKLCIKMNLTKDDSTSRSWLWNFLTNKSCSCFYSHTLTHWFNPFIHRHYRCESKGEGRSYPHTTLTLQMAYPLGKFQFPIVRIKVSCNDTNSFPVRDYSFPVRKPLFPHRGNFSFKPANRLFHTSKQIVSSL